MQTHNN